jgi:hypothetical protein
VLKEQLDLQVVVDLRVLKVPREVQVTEDHKVTQDQEDLPVRQVLKEQLDLPVVVDLRVLKVLREVQVTEDHKVQQDLRVEVEPLVHKVLEDPRGELEPLVEMGSKVLKDLSHQQALLDHRVLKVQEDHKVQQVRPRQDLKVLRVRHHFHLDPKVLKVVKVVQDQPRVLKDNRVL